MGAAEFQCPKEPRQITAGECGEGGPRKHHDTGPSNAGPIDVNDGSDDSNDGSTDVVAGIPEKTVSQDTGKDKKKDGSCRKQWRICDLDVFRGGFGHLYHRGCR